jgi:hypothetical protein
MRAAAGHAFAFYVTLVCLRDPNVGGAGSKNEYPHLTQAGWGWKGRIELTGTKINLSPNDTCVTSEVQGASIFVDSTGLGKRGTRLQAWGWPLKVIIQSNKRTNVLVNILRTNEKLVVHFLSFFICNLIQQYVKYYLFNFKIVDQSKTRWELRSSGLLHSE